MQKGSVDIGTGVGWIFVVDGNGAILFSEKNTPFNAPVVRAMAMAGGPYTSTKSAIGKITIDDPGGELTTLRVNGQSIISGPYVPVSGVTATAAREIADYINTFSPTIKYWAQADGDDIYLYAPLLNAETYNGYEITATYGGGFGLTIVTDFTNGNNTNTTILNSTRRRVYIDADYNGSATGGSISNAVEVVCFDIEKVMATAEITLQDGNTGAITRKGPITRVLVSPQSGTSDDLSQVMLTNFYPGDILVIGVKNKAHTLNIVPSAMNTEDTQGNVYLDKESLYVITGDGTICLMVDNDATRGPIVTEVFRSHSNPLVLVRTQAELDNEITNGLIQVGVDYLVTDAIDNSVKSTTSVVMIKGASVNGLSQSGTGLFWNGDFSYGTLGLGDYSKIPGGVQNGIWNTILGVTEDVTIVIDGGLHYIKRNNNVNTATAPYLNPSDWELLPREAGYGYLFATNLVEYASAGDRKGYITRRYEADLNNDIDFYGMPGFSFGNYRSTGNYWRNGAHSFYNYDGTLTTTKVTGGAVVFRAGSGAAIGNVYTDESFASTLIIIADGSGLNPANIYATGSAGRTFTLTNETDVTITGRKYVKHFVANGLGTYAIGSHLITDIKIPINALVGEFVYKFTGVSSVGSAEIALGIETDDPTVFVAATAYATLNALKPTVVRIDPVVTVAERNIVLTVSVADLNGTDGQLEMDFEAWLL